MLRPILGTAIEQHVLLALNGSTPFRLEGNKVLCFTFLYHLKNGKILYLTFMYHLPFSMLFFICITHVFLNK